MDKRLLKAGIGSLVLSVGLLFAAGGCDMLGMGDGAAGGKAGGKDGKAGGKDGASTKVEIPETSTDIKMPKSLWEKDEPPAYWYKAAKVGDFVVNKNAGGKARSEVLEKGDGTLTVRMTMEASGMQIKSKMVYKFTEPDMEAKKTESKYTMKKGNEKVKIGDKEVDTEWTEVYDGDKMLSKSWMSKEVPLGGIVKVAGGDGKVVQEAVEFGWGK